MTPCLAQLDACTITLPRNFGGPNQAQCGATGNSAKFWKFGPEMRSGQNILWPYRPETHSGHGQSGPTTSYTHGRVNTVITSISYINLHTDSLILR